MEADFQFLEVTELHCLLVVYLVLNKDETENLWVHLCQISQLVGSSFVPVKWVSSYLRDHL